MPNRQAAAAPTKPFGYRRDGFMTLRPKFRGQHIIFYSQVIHNCKIANKIGIFRRFVGRIPDGRARWRKRWSVLFRRPAT